MTKKKMKTTNKGLQAELNEAVDFEPLSKPYVPPKTYLVEIYEDEAPAFTVHRASGEIEQAMLDMRRIYPGKSLRVTHIKMLDTLNFYGAS